MNWRLVCYLGRLTLALVCFSAPARAQEIHFLAEAEIPATSKDQFGETIGGLGSGLAFNPVTEKYLAISDRGPGDGTIEYRPRFHTLDVQVTPGEKFHLKVAVSDSTLLRDRDGKAMTGLVPNAPDAATPRMRDGRTCIDPEAIAVAPDETIYASDEYGPFLYQFKKDGTMLRTLRPPENYLPRTRDGIDFAEHGSLVSGRLANHGFEGLAISPDGKMAALLLQNGLVQDGAKQSRFTRILMVDLQSEKPVAEFAYEFTNADEINAAQRLRKGERLKQHDLSVCELAWWNEHQFLVLERDNQGANGSLTPKAAVFKSIYLIDTRKATNLLELPGKPYDQLPGAAGWRALSTGAEMTPVSKKLLLNFAPAFNRTEFPEKWEGIALTAAEANGHRRMLLACDNDFLTPVLEIEGKSVPFPRAQRSVSTRFLLYDIRLP